MNESTTYAEKVKLAEQEEAARANRDPITGAAGAHPVGTALGGTSGAIAGAVAGTAVAGPAGTLVGAVIGAVAGGLAGKAAGESVNPTEEDSYWRGRFNNEPYYTQGMIYDDYGPAYRAGYEARVEHHGLSFEQAELDLQNRFMRARGTSRLDWPQARPATRAAWERASRNPVV